eukprot:m.387618 g.387618  ORF g.387618 m.387618 type:complete len:72 (+) comp21033_c0_seq7:4385-4600(+)
MEEKFAVLFRDVSSKPSLLMPVAEFEPDWLTILAFNFSSFSGGTSPATSAGIKDILSIFVQRALNTAQLCG